MSIQNIGIIPTASAISEFMRDKTQREHDSSSALADRLGVGGRLSDKENHEAILDADLQKERYAKMIKTNAKITQKIDTKNQFMAEFSSLVSTYKQQLMDVRSEKANPNFSTEITQIFAALEAALNNTSSLGGSSELYSAKCVDFSNLTVPVSALPDYSYCIGGGNGTNISLDPTGATTDVSLFTAQDPLVEQFIRSIRMGLAGDPSDSKGQCFTDALELLDKVEKKAMVVKEVVLGQKKFIADRTTWMEKNYEHTKERYEELSRTSLPELFAHIASTKSALDIQGEHALRDLFSLRELMDKTGRLLG